MERLLASLEGAEGATVIEPLSTPEQCRAVRELLTDTVPPLDLDGGEICARRAPGPAPAAGGTILHSDARGNPYAFNADEFLPADVREYEVDGAGGRLFARVEPRYVALATVLRERVG